MSAFSGEMKQHSSADLDLLAAKGPEPRSDALREAVDQLPPEQNHMVSRVFFGQASIAVAAAEIEVSPARGQELIRRALKTLKKKVQQDHSMGSLFSEVD
jgi:DNA-directed RNA polymerase specialized sigma24 family protein